MSRDRAKIIFALEREVKQLKTDLFLFGSHTWGCRIKRSSYWMPEEDCTCGWREMERRLCEYFSEILSVS